MEVHYAIETTINSQPAGSHCNLSPSSPKVSGFDRRYGCHALSTNLISVPAECKEVSITLNHPGTLPVKVMGHNIVITDRKNLQAVANDGLQAGFDNHFIKPGDNRVYGASKVIGGGESTTMTFSTENMSPEGDYVFLCSFPGHWAMMQGKFELK